MKIAIYSGEIPSTSFVENLITGMSQRGYQVILFGKKKKGYSVVNKGVVIKYFPISYFGILLNLLFSFFRMSILHPKRLVKFIRVYKGNENYSIYYRISQLGRVFIVLNHLPDIFHVQWIKSGHEWLFLKEFGVKVIGSFRGAHINYSPIADHKLAAIYRETFPQYSGFHAVSNAIADEATRYNADLNSIYRIPGAVNPVLLKKRIKVTSVEIKHINILSVGRAHWIKGYSYAMDACKLLKDKGVEFSYIILGANGSEELLYQIDDLGLKNQVQLLDSVPYKDVFSFYDKADVVLLPSLKEGIANVVLEAMAMGVPVVSTDCGGMKEVVEHGVNGWIVPVRDPDAIADVMNSIALGNWDLNSIVLKARDTIKDNHLIPSQLDAFDEMYKQVLQLSAIEEN